MRTKLWILSLFAFGTLGAQCPEGVALDIQVGAGFPSGNMTAPNKGMLVFQGSGSVQFGISGYSTKGFLFDKDLTAIQGGYQFLTNHLSQQTRFNSIPEPASVQYKNRNQLLHGPWIGLEYGMQSRLSPFIGFGAHLLAVRAPRFNLHFKPGDNYYREVQYTPSQWGTLNPLFSASAGLRFSLSEHWHLAAKYQFYGRQFWSMNYKTLAIPAQKDHEEIEGSFVLVQKGWNQTVEVRVQYSFN